MKLTRPQRYLIAFFVVLVIYWTILQISGHKNNFVNYLYSFLFGLVPLFGGLVAIVASNKWGGLRSAIGRAVYFLGVGMFLWGSGAMIWSYYNFFLGVAAPYPSWADLGFAPSVFFYGLGAIFLASATGAKYGLKRKWAGFFVIVSILMSFLVSEVLLVEVARGGVLLSEMALNAKTIFDLAYPLGGFFVFTVFVIVSGLSFRYIGGEYKFDIYAILAGLMTMFIADTVFSYTTSVGTFYNGNFGDLLLTIGLSLITFGILGFYQVKGNKERV